VIPVPTVPGPSDMTLGEVQDIQNTNLVGHASGRFKRRRFYAPGPFDPNQRLYNEQADPRTELQRLNRLRWSIVAQLDALDASVGSGDETPQYYEEKRRLENAHQDVLDQMADLQQAIDRLTGHAAGPYTRQLPHLGGASEFTPPTRGDVAREWARLNTLRRPIKDQLNALNAAHGVTIMTDLGGLPPEYHEEKGRLQRAYQDIRNQQTALLQPGHGHLTSSGHYGGKRIKFHNEHGKKVSVSVVAIPETAGATVRMTLQGPHSIMVNDITLMEARYLHKALSEFLQGNTEFVARAPHR
jgi:hypothetical protein